MIFPKEYEVFDATVQKFLLKTLKTTAHTFFSGAVYACATLFGSPLLLRLSATRPFSLKMTISNVVSSNFSELTSSIATPFAQHTGFLPIGLIYYLIQLLDVCALHWEYCSDLALGPDVY